MLSCATSEWQLAQEGSISLYLSLPGDTRAAIWEASLQSGKCYLWGSIVCVVFGGHCFLLYFSTMYPCKRIFIIWKMKPVFEEAWCLSKVRKKNVIKMLSHVRHSAQKTETPGCRGLGAQGLCLERRACDLSGKSFVSMNQKQWKGALWKA